MGALEAPKFSHNILGGKGPAAIVGNTLSTLRFLERLRRAPVWWGLFVVWFAVLMGFSSLPSREVPLPAVPFADKVVHFGYFVGGGILLGLAASLTFSWPAVRTMVVSAVVLAAVGALDEWHQLYVPGRSGGDAGDWTADFLGGVAGLLVAAKIYERFGEGREAGR